LNKYGITEPFIGEAGLSALGLDDKLTEKIIKRLIKWREIQRIIDQGLPFQCSCSCNNIWNSDYYNKYKCQKCGEVLDETQVRRNPHYVEGDLGRYRYYDRLKEHDYGYDEDKTDSDKMYVGLGDKQLYQKWMAEKAFKPAGRGYSERTAALMDVVKRDVFPRFVLF
jgi:hypothetical protein